MLFYIPLIGFGGEIDVPLPSDISMGIPSWFVGVYTAAMPTEYVVNILVFLLLTTSIVKSPLICLTIMVARQVSVYATLAQLFLTWLYSGTAKSFVDISTGFISCSPCEDGSFSYGGVEFCFVRGFFQQFKSSETVQSRSLSSYFYYFY